MDARFACLSLRPDRLGDLRRVLQDERGRDCGDAVCAAEGRLQIEVFAVAKALPKFSHDADVRPGEPEYRLPVVTDGEQLGSRRPVEQRLEQPRSVG